MLQIMTKRRIKFLFRFSIGFAILCILLWKIGPSKIGGAFSQFKGSAFALVNLTTAFAFLVAGLEVLVLGRTMSEKLRWVRGIKGFLATTSFSLFVPGRAGDFALLFYWKDFLSYEECFTVVLLDKVIIVWWTLLLGAVGTRVIFGAYLGLIILLPGVLAIPVFLLLIPGDKAYRALSRVVPGRILPNFQGMINALRFILKDGRKSLFVATAITGVRMLIYGLSFWILMQGFSIDCPFSYSLFTIIIAQLTSLIPISIMGLGTVEAVTIYCLSGLKIDSGAIIAAQFAGRIVYISWLFLFFILFSSKKTQIVDPAGLSG